LDHAAPGPIARHRFRTHPANAPLNSAPCCGKLKYRIRRSGGTSVNRREKVSIALLASAAIVSGRLFYAYIRRGRWPRFW